jgi:transposase
MTTTKASGKKATYIRHSQEYKREALKLAADLGIAKAAKQLGLHESQLYAWRKDSEHAQTVSEREAALAAENVRLKRQLAQQAEELSILKNEATYFAQQLKRGTTT